MRKALGLCLLSFAAIAAIAPHAAAQGPGRGMGGGNLLTNKSVQAELKLTPEQLTKVEALATEIREKQTALNEGSADLSQEERREKAMALQAEMRAAGAKILKAEQVVRFDQISLQQQGANALLTPAVAAKLTLSEEQSAKIKEINADTMLSMTELRKTMQGDREGAMKRMTETRKAAMDKAAALLSADQKKTWAEMVGTPFELKVEPRRPA